MARRSSEVGSGVLVHPLSYVRWERGWSLQDTVNRIAAHLKGDAARREKAWRWENWAVVPDDDTQEALAKELGVPLELVRSLRWPHWLPTGPCADIEASWDADGSLSLLQRTAGAAVLDRRGFLVLTAGTTSALAQSWVEIESPQLVSVLRGGMSTAPEN